MDDSGNTEDERRGRRQVSSSKQKKLALLEKIKNSRQGGKKNKYEIGEIENVYEEVDERSYSKKVLERQEDDWIVDDDGCGYVEDGRDIFDDDLDEESVQRSKKDGGGKKRSRSSFEGTSESKKGHIRNMLVSMPAKKKKESCVKLEEDNLLDDILGELDRMSNSPKPGVTKLKEETSARDYMKSLASKKVKKTEVKEETIKPQVLKENVIESHLRDRGVEEMEVDHCSPAKLTIKPDTPIMSIKTEPMNEDSAFIDNEPEEQAKVKEENISENNLSSVDLFGGIDMEELGALMDQPSEEKSNAQVSKPQKIKASECTTTFSKTEDQLKSLKNTELIEEGISEQWTSNCSEEAPINVQVDRSKLPLTTNKNGDNVFRFFYWDAHEEQFSQPGTVFLFGKVYIESAKAYASCCVSIKNIERRVYLLPREKRMNLKTGQETEESISISDVYDEFTKLTEQYKIKMFKSRRTMKKYAFGKEDIPAESEYLEVRYAANYPALPTDLKGETFSHVFGTKTSFLELFVLDRGLQGPSWLDISNPEPNNVQISWCKVEVTCNKPTDVARLVRSDAPEIPPLVLVTLVPQILYNVKAKQSEVVAVGCLVNDKYPVDKPAPQRMFNQHFCVVSRPSNTPWPYDLREEMQKFNRTRVEKMESERALLNFLLTKLYRTDPDIIIGHDLSGFGLDVMIERLGHHKVPNWSRFGRLRRANFPHGKGKFHLERTALTGRLMCDIKISAKELIKSRSYDMETLCQNVLHIPEGKRPEMNDDIFKYSYSSGELLLKSLWTLMTDASYILKMFAELNVLPLGLQITNIAGNVMSRTLMGGRSERNEFLLLHAFHSKDFIVPDKEYKKNSKKTGEDGDEIKQGKKKPSYAGGLVLDPKVGLYDDLILLMDFNSLYPSIIQEYNICFTTIPIAGIKMDEDFFDDFDSLIPSDTIKPGILPTEIRKLVESRKDVKSLLRTPHLSPELRMQYDIRQMALKLTANSMYGCLGFSNSRFYAKPLAALVTAKGREILMNTKKMVESYGHDVIYGDTDSLMINTRTKDFDQVYQIGRKIKVEVNKSYKQVELDIDGIFKHMLLLRKKKYAATTVTKLPNGELSLKKEIKGLDIVRRDWSQLSAEVGMSVLDQILCDQSQDDRIENIHGYLETIRQELEEGKVPLSLLTVTKQLTKAAEDYADAKALPHVQVAIRLNKLSAKRFKQGDTVSYVICLDGTEKPATQRAYHSEEYKNPANDLKIDTNYYLSQQIHPVVARLCDPIEGTDAASIARCLGLDPTMYRRRTVINHEEDEDAETIFSKKEEERFKDCQRLKLICKNPACLTENIIEAPIKRNEKGIDVLVLEHCQNPTCNLSPLSYLDFVSNQLQVEMREHIKKYFERWLICDDPLCLYRSRCHKNKFEGAYPLCTRCEHSTMRREITSLQLYNQLSFYAHMFDLSKLNLKKVKLEEDTLDAYRMLFTQTQNILKNSKYSIVDLAFLFSGIFPVYNVKPNI